MSAESGTPRCDAVMTGFYVVGDIVGLAHQLERELSAEKARAEAAEEENTRFRNGLDNLLAALDDAPGLPMELLSKDDLQKWTDTITGILIALGAYRVSGKPITIMEHLQYALRHGGANEAKP